MNTTQSPGHQPGGQRPLSEFLKEKSRPFIAGVASAYLQKHLCLIGERPSAQDIEDVVGQTRTELASEVTTEPTKTANVSYVKQRVQWVTGKYIMKRRRELATASLDAPIAPTAPGSENDGSLEDCIPDASACRGYAYIELNDIMRIIEKSCPPKVYYALAAYVYAGQDYEITAEELKMQPMALRQAKLRAVKQILRSSRAVAALSELSPLVQRSFQERASLVDRTL
jgi:hypothetical protein